VGDEVRYRVKERYEASTDAPLVVAEGERLVFERRRTRWPGWIWCKAPSGKTGWVPESWTEIENESCVMKRDYNARELSVPESEELIGILTESEWALVVRSSGGRGWVPLEHLARI
jgi:hypothetical protein